MTETVENLILDLLESVGSKERSYQETFARGGHSAQNFRSGGCERSRVVETASVNGGSLVRLTPTGLALLKEQRPSSALYT